MALPPLTDATLRAVSRLSPQKQSELETLATKPVGPDALARSVLRLLETEFEPVERADVIQALNRARLGWTPAGASLANAEFQVAFSKDRLAFLETAKRSASFELGNAEPIRALANGDVVDMTKDALSVLGLSRSVLLELGATALPNDEVKINGGRVRFDGGVAVGAYFGPATFTALSTGNVLREFMTFDFKHTVREELDASMKIVKQTVD